VLADNFVLEWPQSDAAMNSEYPAKGRWTFTINRLVGNDEEAVSDITEVLCRFRKNFNHTCDLKFGRLALHSIETVIEELGIEIFISGGRAHITLH